MMELWRWRSGDEDLVVVILVEKCWLRYGDEDMVVVMMVDM